jgi:IS1 family transposase
VWISPDTNPEVFELDELYWFIGKKAHAKTKENVYMITAISREPRQIVGFEADQDKSAKRIQKVVDNAPPAKFYCTDGYIAYCDVTFLGKHIRNSRDKSDTHNVESINADLRHYIPGLKRRSRCFYRSIQTLQAVLSVFIDAYNKFGEAKMKYRILATHKPTTTATHLHKYQEWPFSVLDFI